MVEVEGVVWPVVLPLAGPLCREGLPTGGKRAVPVGVLRGSGLQWTVPGALPLCAAIGLFYLSAARCHRTELEATGVFKIMVVHALFQEAM